MVRRTIPARDLPEGLRFRAGRLCRDFTVTGGEGRRSVYERLHQPADLARRFARSELKAPVTAASAEDLATAKHLREAIWQVANAIARQRPVAPSDVATINRVAATLLLVPEFCGGPDGTAWAGAVRWAQRVGAAAALSTLARDAVALFGGAPPGGSGSAPATTAHFSSWTPPPGGRRWCSMERCGNRTKLRAMRARRRDEESVA